MSSIKCMVEECKYNKKHKCRAESIEVRSNGDMAVDTSDGTACDTFTKLERLFKQGRGNDLCLFLLKK